MEMAVESKKQIERLTEEQSSHFPFIYANHKKSRFCFHSKSIMNQAVSRMRARSFAVCTLDGSKSLFLFAAWTLEWRLVELQCSQTTLFGNVSVRLYVTFAASNEEKKNCSNCTILMSVCALEKKLMINRPIGIHFIDTLKRTYTRITLNYQLEKLLLREILRRKPSHGATARQ